MTSPLTPQDLDAIHARVAQVLALYTDGHNGTAPFMLTDVSRLLAEVVRLTEDNTGYRDENALAGAGEEWIAVRVADVRVAALGEDEREGNA